MHCANETHPLARIYAFLGAPTPTSWLLVAQTQLPKLLIDHAHCEKKAAAAALSMIYRYPDRLKLLHAMTRLAREELQHFSQVIRIMTARNITYSHLTPARYADNLRKFARTSEPGKLVDLLIIGAYIEARSCERFAALVPYVDPELAQFFAGLLATESRHFESYLQLAAEYSQEPIATRIAFFKQVEENLITTPDSEFRFHSGIPTEL